MFKLITIKSEKALSGFCDCLELNKKQKEINS